ncbi:MAG TPA: UDP-3-O-(3-hydroxymyristoyl)glucosamine N-acyltransferase [Candidatus Binataceae bacterium]|nr:UDP-3-O-(3-hydroxymyristoyl)glucosamine N-acyltransferase [Candidatus Binataceae bacterium]
MKLSELAARLGLELHGDGETEIVAPAPIDAAAEGTITFAVGAKYAAALRVSRAAAAIVPAELSGGANRPLLISANPVFDFARVLEIFFPPYRPPAEIHPSAVIAADARIGANASIGAYCVIGAGVTVGHNAVIHPHVTIYPRVRIGDDFTCHSHVSIREGVTIGSRVTLLNGAVIGADGFGFVEHRGDLIKVPQVGSVLIEDDVEIGANTTIDRATMGVTIIHRGVKLDNLIQVAHNCEVGDYSRMAAQTGLAGSVKIGKWCQVGGQSGFADHATVGDRARVIAQSGVHNALPDDALVGGYPAVDGRLFRRVSAIVPRLPAMLRRLRAVEKHLGIESEHG